MTLNRDNGPAAGPAVPQIIGLSQYLRPKKGADL